MISAELKTLYDTVKELLESRPLYRDNDKALSCKIWTEELGGMEAVKNISAYDFMVKYSKGELYSQESIGRVARMLKEDNPELRGEKYKERLKQMEEVQKELGYKIDMK